MNLVREETQYEIIKASKMWGKYIKSPVNRLKHIKYKTGQSVTDRKYYV